MWCHTRKKHTSPFKSAGVSVQLTTGGRDVRIGGSNAGYTMYRGSVKGTGYQFHSPVSPSLPPVSHRVPSRFNRTLLPLMRTPLLPVVEWTDTPANLNGLVRFAERWNLVSACVPSHFKHSLHFSATPCAITFQLDYTTEFITLQPRCRTSPGRHNRVQPHVISTHTCDSFCSITLGV